MKKIKNWLKKDLKFAIPYCFILFIYGLSFFSDLNVLEEISWSILLGLVGFFKLKIAISFFRLIFKTFWYGGQKTNSNNKINRLNESEKIIVDELTKKIKTAGNNIKLNLDEMIVSEIKKTSHYKEEWQINYSKDRIKSVITELLQK